MEEKEVVLTPKQVQKQLQFLAYLNNKFAQIDALKRYEKWHKDGMWKAIVTGQIVENTKKKRAKQQ